MQTLIQPEVEELDDIEAEPPRWRIDVPTYNRLINEGFFEGRRVELMVFPTVCARFWAAKTQ